MTNSHPPTALDRDPGSICERCRRCAGCHAEIGGCPVPNTSCVIGREDCGMPAESHLDCNESGLVTHSRHSFRRYPAATGREPEDRLLQSGDGSKSACRTTRYGPGCGHPVESHDGTGDCCCCNWKQNDADHGESCLRCRPIIRAYLLRQYGSEDALPKGWR